MENKLSKGFLVAAQNTQDIDYVKQAYALALSIKLTQKEVNSISIMTNDIVPEQYKLAFDEIIPIPWNDAAESSSWKIENRWKLYHVTPYQETIVLDTDMLLLDDISKWWEYCSRYDLQFCNRIKNYKNEIFNKDFFHRKAFIENKLSNPYTALHYFKKCETAHNFYKTLEFVTFNWIYFWDKFNLKNYQDWFSMDLATAVSIELLDLHDDVFSVVSPLEFVHMRPALQGWPDFVGNWTSLVPCLLNSKGQLIIGNMKQAELFHYIEKDFVTDSMIRTYERLLLK